MRGVTVSYNAAAGSAFRSIYPQAPCWREAARRKGRRALGRRARSVGARSARGLARAAMSLVLFTAIAPCTVLGNVTPLNPTNWHEQLAGRTWMVTFAVTGCKHCELMKPMWQEMARELAASDSDVHVGRVNSSLHNGLTKTMRVTDEPALEPN